MKLVPCLSFLPVLFGAIAGPPNVRRQEPAKATVLQAEDPYDQHRPREVLRFFALASDTPDLATAATALAELDARVIYGPQTAPRRKGTSFVTVRAPAQAAERDLLKALRRAGGVARPLTCTVFDGAGPPLGGLDDDTLDDVLMWFDSAAWIDCAGSRTQVYSERGPSAKEAQALVERYSMMLEQNAHLGQLRTETFTWELTSAPDAATASRVLRAVRKLEGVAEATLEVTSLTVKVQLLAVEISGVAGALHAPGPRARTDAQGRMAPRASWGTLALHDLLRGEGLLAPEPGGPAEK